MTEQGNFLQDRVALVTGGSRNLGAEIARIMTSRGARVAISYLSSRASAESVIAGLGGERNIAVNGDLSTPEGIDKIVTETEKRLQARVDILINNVGPFSMTPFLHLEPAEFDFIWNANVRAAYLAARRVAPGMISNGWGRIVNMSAGSAFLRTHSVYSLAKNAMITLTEQLAVELAPHVTVNCVAPGQIAESGSDMAAFDPDFVSRTIARTPVGRLATRNDVARVVLALCSQSFDMVTGATVPVDGGARLATG